MVKAARADVLDDADLTQRPLYQQRQDAINFDYDYGIVPSDGEPAGVGGGDDDFNGPRQPYCPT